MQLNERPKINELIYDKKCMHMFTGVRAIWHLWRRGRWELLTPYGLTPELIDQEFRAFEESYITASNGRLPQDSQIEALLDSLSQKAAEEVLSTALAWNAKYAAQYKQGGKQ